MGLPSPPEQAHLSGTCRESMSIRIAMENYETSMG